jgi:hypothetical protein
MLWGVVVDESCCGGKAEVIFCVARSKLRKHFLTFILNERPFSVDVVEA